jgi:hypothetical protein
VPLTLPRPAAKVLRSVRETADDIRPWRLFDRPVFVVAMPRSGSTLLLDMLQTHPVLWSWHGEATEGWHRARPDGHTVLQGDTWPRHYATEELRRRAERTLFRDGVLARMEKRHEPKGVHGRIAHRPIRYLDKTPANSCRVGVLADLWPDARFVFLHRDGPSNVASLVEAWDSRLGVRDPILDDGRQVTWRMLLPEGWIDHLDETVAEKCAFQWNAGNASILDGLARVDPARIAEVRYDDLVEDPLATARRLCDFAEVPFAPEVAAFCAEMPPSRVVLSVPRKEKWRERADELAPALPTLAAMSERLGYSTDW